MRLEDILAKLYDRTIHTQPRSAHRSVQTWALQEDGAYLSDDIREVRSAYPHIWAEDQYDNFCKNPSAEVDLSWWNTFGQVSRDTTQYYVGRASFKLVYESGEYTKIVSPYIACEGGQGWTVSFYYLLDGTGEWARHTKSVATNPGATKIAISIYLRPSGELYVYVADDESDLCEEQVGTVTACAHIDGIQLEQGDTATPYCDGDQPGCQWVGKPHRSESYRLEQKDPREAYWDLGQWAEDNE